MPSDQNIASLLKSLADDQFDDVAGWETCHQFVKQVISRSKLPASQYAPDSRFGGIDWTEDDFVAVAGEWCSHMLNNEAAEIVGVGRTDRHIANAAKQSIRQFVVDRVKGNPRRDLWESLKDQRCAERL